MGSRVELHEELKEVLGSDNVYFQPPSSMKMKFPCIVYERVRINTQYANNNPYQHYVVYQVTYIDKYPDSDIPMKLADMHQSAFERAYKANEMYHTVFRLTY